MGVQLLGPYMSEPIILDPYQVHLIVGDSHLNMAEVSEETASSVPATHGRSPWGFVVCYCS